ncbi:radical SAM family heme chaperone HemW [bacterium]|nr:radical SAM family heme chaperone HemW [bacterium]
MQLPLFFIMKLALYIHIPFCIRKCKYCAFYSVPYQENLVSYYIRALSKEIEFYRKHLSESEIVSVYIGGGTPSLISPDSLEEIIVKIKKYTCLSPGIEFTIEVNPKTLSSESASRYRSLGINRCSVGIQSLNDNELKVLGRPHDAQEAMQCLNLLMASQWENISVDLIYGIPDQTLKSWGATLKLIGGYDIHHISTYCLSYEPGTALNKNKENNQLQPLSPELEEEMYFFMVDHIQDYGYEHYEISSFARTPEFYSRHNINYWLGNPYLGFGPAAVSTIDDKGRLTRHTNYSDLDKYIKQLERGQLPVQSMEILEQTEQINEYIMLHLRLIEGLSLAEFERKFSLSFQEYAGESLKYLLDDGFLEFKNNYIRIPSSKLFISNSIISELF